MTRLDHAGLCVADLDSAVAFSERAFGFRVEVSYAIWTDPSDDERHASWVAGHHERLSSTVGEGLYLGDSDFGRRPDRFMTDPHFQRLLEIRAARDPENRFIYYLTMDGAVLNQPSA